MSLITKEATTYRDYYCAETPDQSFERIKMSLENFFEDRNQYTDALVELLKVLCFKGSSKDLLVALPDKTINCLEALRDVFARLNYETEILNAAEVDFLQGPAVFINVDQKLRVLVPGDEIPDSGEVMLLTKLAEEVEYKKFYSSWFTWTLSSMWEQVSAVCFVSLFINLVALSIPLFSRYVYDSALPARSELALVHITIGILIVLSFGMIFRILRSRLLTYAGGRLNYLAGVDSMSKILTMPLSILIKSNTDSHLVRVRDLERLREVVVGSFSTSLLDAPFVLLFLGVIWYIGGVLVIIPVVVLFGYALFIPLFSSLEARTMRKASQVNSKCNRMKQNAIDNYKDIVSVGVEDRWLEIFSKTLVESAAINRKLALVSSFSSVISRTVASMTALATLAGGTALVINQVISPGSLIASMMLIWRVTAPVQSFATSFSKYFQLKKSAEQIDRLMDLKGENLDESLVSPLTGMPADIELSRVVYRHNPDREPALAGVSLNIKNGELIGVTGSNGSGKTTLLECISGLLQPQGGSVKINGRDLRHFQPEDLRSWIGYMLNDGLLMEGTLRENLLIVKPEASIIEIEEALNIAGVGSLATRLDDQMYDDRGLILNKEEQYGVCFARVLLKKPKLLILDNPVFTNTKMRKNFLLVLGRMKGHSTILISSQDREFLEMCDKVLVLEAGVPVSFKKLGKVKAVIKRNNVKPSTSAE